MPALPPAGLLLIDKPEGWTSHDVVAALRGPLGTKRVGHAGTLDPLATGLLVVLYGAATRLSAELHRAPKAYLGEVLLGKETTTDDREGQAVAAAAVPELEDARVSEVLASFVGVREQIPPAYSAIQIRGERAYAKARRGERVALAPRAIEIFDLRLLERGAERLHVLVTCSAGTYVRALARDLGRALGTRAHLGALRRIAVGSLFVDDAVGVEEARELARAGALAPHVVAPDVAALALPGPALAEEAARRLPNGLRVGIAEVHVGAAWPRKLLGRQEG